eukprot:TRINITY_DN35581_c0_g1_i1.p1 TRINITY_DN35581_c0_g1~~TRINITY_DN35581_c0_g1_i1.p1  ORF type:complete len:136 (+),score=24.16 TRINITY_DN35581_c0_g1_i1:63-470(+)
MTKLETTKRLVKIYSIGAALSSSVFCVFSLVKNDIPKPVVQWSILYVYLPLICFAGVLSEIGWTKGATIDKYAHLLNTGTGRACLYIFCGCLLLNSGWQILFGILLCAAGGLNIMTMCKTDKEKEAEEDDDGAVN